MLLRQARVWLVGGDGMLSMLEGLLCSCDCVGTLCGCVGSVLALMHLFVVVCGVGGVCSGLGYVSSSRSSSIRAVGISRVFLNISSVGITHLVDIVSMIVSTRVSIGEAKSDMY